MKRTRQILAFLAVALLLLCLWVAGPVSAQQPTPGQPGQDFQKQRDPLALLKQELQQAGAPALDSNQEQQLTALVDSFRSNLPRPEGDSALKTAHSNFENAILNGDTNAANSAAAAMANEISRMTQTRMQAQAQFGIQALSVLKSNSAQFTALQQRVGTAGLIRILRSLTGGPGMFMRVGPGGPMGGGRGRGRG